jgi:hypothetical protein
MFLHFIFAAPHRLMNTRAADDVHGTRQSTAGATFSRAAKSPPFQPVAANGFVQRASGWDQM